MTRIFKTRKNGIYFVFEGKVSEATITKCTGYFMEGIFFGIQVLDKKKMTGDDLETAKEILEKCFTKVFELDVIKIMKQHLKTL